MENSVPTNPEIFFATDVCSKCKHRACHSLATEEISSNGTYRFELNDNITDQACPFYGSSQEEIKKFLHSAGIDKLNQIYRYLANEIHLQQTGRSLEKPPKKLEGKGAKIMELVTELISKKKVNAFGVSPNYNNNQKIRAWMNSHLK